MLAELKFVRGAVAKKDLLPALTHFKIEDGFVRSFNGKLALCSPIALDINCVPKAIPFIKAIENCTETVSLTMTPTGRLSVKSGKFRAYIECVDDETPHVIPEGKMVPLDGELLLAALKACQPFIGNDASRPWCNGVLLRGKSAFATNNVSLVEYWLGVDLPGVFNIPSDCVTELLRIGEPPCSIQVADSSVTFHYEDGKWIRTAMLDTSWPDLGKVLNVEANPRPINETLFEGLEALKPFTDKIGRVYFEGDKLCTSLDENEGARFNLDGESLQGCYQLSILALLKGVAHVIDFDRYPKPAIFYGDNLRGAIVGIRV